MEAQKIGAFFGRQFEVPFNAYDFKFSNYGSDDDVMWKVAACIAYYFRLLEKIFGVG